jgi:Protein of unknown function (DUF3105)
MTGRKEERERLRQERLAAQQAAQSSDKMRLYLGYAVAGLIVLAMLAGLFTVITGGDDSREQTSSDFPELAYIQPEIGVVPDGIKLDDRAGTAPPAVENAILDEAAEAANCELQLDLPDEGNTHIEDEDAAKVDYKTNPPTSGDHYGNSNETASGALADGAYLEFPPVGRWVHSMEHGRVVIHYSPDLPEEDQLAIKGVFEESPAGVIMFPNPDLDGEVAVTSWTQLATCGKYEGAATLDLIRAFRDIYRGQGPEGNFPLSV